MLKFAERKDLNIKDRDYVKTVSAVLNPQDNGGESVTLDVDFYHNGDQENAVWTNIHLSHQCYGIHSNKQSYWAVGVNAFEEAFRHMAEVATLVEKAGPPNRSESKIATSGIGVEAHTLQRIKELIENAENYDVIHDIAALVGAEVK